MGRSLRSLVGVNNVVVNGQPLHKHLRKLRCRAYPDLPSMADGIPVDQYHDEVGYSSNDGRADAYRAEDFILSGQGSRRVAGMRRAHSSHDTRYDCSCANCRGKARRKDVNRFTHRRDLTRSFSSIIEIEPEQYSAIMCLRPNIEALRDGIDRRQIRRQAMKR